MNTPPDFRNACIHAQVLANSLQNWLSRQVPNLSQAEASMLLDSYTHLAFIAGGLRGYLERQNEAMTLLDQLEKTALASEGIEPRFMERARMSALIAEIRGKLVFTPGERV
jgi:hypothetical protein